MSCLVDTNVLSELRRRAPDPGVVAWFSARPAATLFLSVLTLGEIRQGIEAVADTERRLKLVDWLEIELPAFFIGRVLAIDAAVADRWGRLMAAAGRPLPAVDSLLAATAIEHDLALVTRNVGDFAGLPVQVLDPWSRAGQQSLSDEHRSLLLLIERLAEALRDVACAQVDLFPRSTLHHGALRVGGLRFASVSPLKPGQRCTPAGDPLLPIMVFVQAG